MLKSTDLPEGYVPVLGVWLSQGTHKSLHTGLAHASNFLGFKIEVLGYGAHHLVQ